jgi:UDP-N-acetyl-D-glucosamine/UDP-N-acetyl-D-galactosamine dehydrogenase
MERFAILGLGYVGLPVAVAFARTDAPVVGFDIDRTRIEELRAGHDRTREVPDDELAASACTFTADPADLEGATFFIVTVPTPIDAQRRPDLGAVKAASRTVGRALRPGAVVVYESTVYPGVTEEVCGPILEAESGLRAGQDFFLGYSPERINPGDREHRFERITKVVSGQDAATLDRVARAYATVVEAGVHRAPTIKVAEAAKVIENTQRDLNIALMNELAVIFARLGIRTVDVLEAAGTKWNFLPFQPGLVGGHCIGVDPYYLTAKAESVGYHPEVILAGRRVNDGMGAFVAHQVVKALNRQGRSGAGARIGVLGLTFKEDVPDIRNSRVPDIVHELRDYGAEVRIHDPLADAAETRHEWGLDIDPLDALTDLDALVLAVKHASYLHDPSDLVRRVRPGGVIFDVKSVLAPEALPEGRILLSL